MTNRVFLDTNVFIDMFCNSKKFENSGIRSSVERIENTKALLEEYSYNNIFVISSMTLANTFFIFTNKNRNPKHEVSKQLLKIEENDNLFMIVEEDKSVRLSALRYSIENDTDYEDALQYFCALQNGCKLIITDDKDFPQLDIALKRTSLDMNEYIPTLIQE